MIGKSYDLVIIGPPKGRVFATLWRPCDRRLTLCTLVTHMCLWSTSTTIRRQVTTWSNVDLSSITNMHYLPTVTNHISNPLSSVHPICINSLINFVLELVSHLLRVKQWKKKNNVALFSMLIGYQLKALLNWFIISSLTHWGRDNIFQTTFWKAFSWMKMFDFRLRFHGTLFHRVQLTIFQHWFR